MFTYLLGEWLWKTKSCSKSVVWILCVCCDELVQLCTMTNMQQWQNFLNIKGLETGNPSTVQQRPESLTVTHLACVVRHNKSLCLTGFGLVQRVVSEEVVAGTEIPAGGRRGRLYLTLHCHHQSDSCIKTGSNESHFNVLFAVSGKVTKTVSVHEPQPLRRETCRNGIEPRSFCLPA